MAAWFFCTVQWRQVTSSSCIWCL